MSPAPAQAVAAGGGLEKQPGQGLEVWTRYYSKGTGKTLVVLL